MAGRLTWPGVPRKPVRMKVLRHPRFVAFVVVLIVATLLLVRPLGGVLAVVSGFDVAALVFLLSTLPLWSETGGQASRDRAARDDGGRGFLALVSVITPGVVMTALVQLIRSSADPEWPDLVLVVTTLVLVWGFANMVYAFHYDHIFHLQRAGKDQGGLAFPRSKDPVFADFCYFAFTIGMTAQTADVQIESARLRRTVLGQALLSYGFNLGVLALVINLVAGFL